MFELYVTEKGGQTQRLQFDKDELLVGRVAGNDVVLPKGNVSKRHASIVRQDGRFFVVDLKSTNGTYLNGRRVTTPTVVRPGDKIYLGDFVLVVDADGSYRPQHIPASAWPTDARPYSPWDPALPTDRPYCPALIPVEPQLADACPLAATDVRARVTGLVVEYDITQRFVNTAPTPIEAVVRLPLPDDAAVMQLEVRQGTRRLEAVVRERERAQQAYAEAVDRGRRAAIAEEVRRNLLLLRVANLAPGVPIDVRVRVASPLALDAGEATLTFPATLTPRYVPAGRDPDDARKVSPPFARAGERLYGLSFALELEAGVPVFGVRSPSHALEIAWPGENTARVTLREGEVLPDRDLVVTFGLATALDAPLIATARATEAGAATVMVALPPPASADDETILPRHVTFLLDRSGSMAGEPIESARRALRAFLRALGPRDTFAIIAFDDRCEVFGPAPFDDGPLRLADEWLARIDARGGTEILPALEAALRYTVAPEAVRTVVLLTDGSVANEDEVAKAVARAARGCGLRAHAIGIGPSVNRLLVKRVARAGRGLAEFVAEASDLEAALARFQARTGAPLASDVSLDCDEGAAIDVAPALAPDVDLGRPVLLFARALESGRATLVLRARVGGKPTERRYAIEVPAGVHGNPAITALWARARVDDMLAAADDGAAPASSREEIVRLALAHRVLTPYTALLAIDYEDAGTGVTPRIVEVPVHMPAGLAMDPASSGGSTRTGAVSSNYYASASFGAPVVQAAPRVAAPAMPASPARAAPPGAVAGGRPPPPPPAPAARASGPAASRPPVPAAPMVPQQFDELELERAVAAAPAPMADPSRATTSGRAASARRFEGSDAERVAAALRFLARAQGASGAFGDDAAVTALVLRAFAAAGETPQRGLYRRQLARAAAFVARAGTTASEPPAPAARAALLDAQVAGGDDDGGVLGVGASAVVATAHLVIALAAAGTPT